MSDVRVFYNEIDPYCCAWLSNLMDAGHIRPGTICDKSIADLTPADLEGYDLAHFFAGIAGWDIALTLAGWRFDGRTTWTGSCPCQPFSTAGKQRGRADERHLWPEMRRLIAECRPAVCFGEQVASRAGRAWLAGVRADLEALGYAVGGADLCAAGVGAPHIRQRLYWCSVRLDDSDRGGRERTRVYEGPRREIGAAPHAHRAGEACGVGYPECARLEGQPGHGDDRSEPGRLDAHANGSAAKTGGAVHGPGFWSAFDIAHFRDGTKQRIERGTFPLVDGLPEGLVRGGDRRMAPDAARSAEARVMRLRGYGNAIVPQIAATFLLCNFQLQRDETPIR